MIGFVEARLLELSNDDTPYVSVDSLVHVPRDFRPGLNG